MIEKAITKINAEIQKAPNDTYRAIIGEYIIDHILTEDDAAKILDEDKTLEKALEEVVSKAQKQAQKNKAVIVSTTVFGWVMEYFGLECEEKAYPQTPAEKPKAKGIVLSLNDFF